MLPQAPRTSPRFRKLLALDGLDLAPGFPGRPGRLSITDCLTPQRGLPRDAQTLRKDIRMASLLTLQTCFCFPFTTCQLNFRHQLVWRQFALICPPLSNFPQQSSRSANQSSNTLIIQHGATFSPCWCLRCHSYRHCCSPPRADELLSGN